MRRPGPDEIDDIAQRLYAAEQNRTPIRQLSLEFPHLTVEDAYAVQRALVGLKVADGRVYTGEQAKALGLVDELGGLDRAVQIAGERSGITGEPTIERVTPRRWPWWMRAAFSEDSEASVRPGGLASFLLALARAAETTDAPAQGALLWRMPMVTDGVRW